MNIEEGVLGLRVRWLYEECSRVPGSVSNTTTPLHREREPTNNITPLLLESFVCPPESRLLRVGILVVTNECTERSLIHF